MYKNSSLLLQSLLIKLIPLSFISHALWLQTACNEPYSSITTDISTQPSQPSQPVTPTDSFEIIEPIEPIEQVDSSPKTTRYTVERGDSFLRILKLHNIENRYNILQEISKIADLSWKVTNIQPGDVITFVEPVDAPPSFQIEISQYQTLIVQYTSPIAASIDEKETQITPETVTTTIESSFWKAASDMKLTASQIIQMAKVFESHIDFGTEIYGGETLIIWADWIYLNDQTIGVDNIHSVIFENQKETIQVYQIILNDKTVWLDKDGRSVNRPFLRSPVEFNHISSGFGAKRKTGYHGGVDFAARTGIPVRAVADGIVKLADWNGGYGKQVQIDHPKYGPYFTSYAHLSKINVNKKQSVKQGDIIGLVGSTGNSSGPHVHYELKVNGKRVNPLEHTLPNAYEITPAEQRTFHEQLHDLEKQFSNSDSADKNTP